MSVSSVTKAKRSVANRAAEHERNNSFCAAHPDLSSRRPSAVQSEPDVVEKTYRRAEQEGVRAHVRASHVMVTKKK